MFFLNCFSVAGSKEIISISSRRLNSRFAVEELKKNSSRNEQAVPGAFVLLWIGVSRIFLLRLGYADVVCEFEKSGKT